MPIPVNRAKVVKLKFLLIKNKTKVLDYPQIYPGDTTKVLSTLFNCFKITPNRSPVLLF